VEEAPGTGFEYGTDGPRVILVGVDGSDSSWRAAAYAGGLARRQGSRLVVVYVQSVSPLVAFGGVAAAATEVTSEVADQILAEIREATERVADSFRIRWEFHSVNGEPFSGLAKMADELRADAVVVGASEHAGHRFIGSLAVRLVKAARWPVTVVP
jgi:nucleotide-binding universal stress UspA family protein